MELKANNGTISMEITITRKETGAVEKYILAGEVVPERIPVVHEASGNLVAQDAGLSN